MRDVSRFIILYKWFTKSLLDKILIAQQPEDLRSKERYQENVKKYKLKIEEYHNLEENEIDLRATILSICHCYYLRISNLPDRRKFLTELSNA